MKNEFGFCASFLTDKSHCLVEVHIKLADENVLYENQGFGGDYEVVVFFEIDVAVASRG